MSLFNIGGSKSSSQQQSSSLDLGANLSQSFSDSLARSLSQGTSTQGVWNADTLKQLYADAFKAAGDVNTPLFTGQAADLFTKGSSFLDSLGVGAGEDYLSSRLTDTSARDSQLATLKTGLGELFRDELNPAITARHVAGGTLGGGRQAVAQGAAVKAIESEYSKGASSILASDQAQRDQAAATLGTLSTNRANVGLSSLSSLLGIAGAGMNAPLSPYATLASILGGPTVLTQSQESASSESVARAISEALGFNYGTSQATGSSKSKSFEFGGGGF